MRSPHSNKPGHRWDTTPVNDEQHIVARRCGCIWKPPIGRGGLQRVFTAAMEKQLNYTLLSVSVVRGRHWSRQYYFFYLISVGRFNLKVFTEVHMVGYRVDYRPAAFEQVGRLKDFN